MIPARALECQRIGSEMFRVTPSGVKFRVRPLGVKFRVTPLGVKFRVTPLGVNCVSNQKHGEEPGHCP